MSGYAAGTPHDVRMLRHSARTHDVRYWLPIGLLHRTVLTFPKPGSKRRREVDSTTTEAVEPGTVRVRVEGRRQRHARLAEQLLELSPIAYRQRLDAQLAALEEVSDVSAAEDEDGSDSSSSSEEEESTADASGEGSQGQHTCWIDSSLKRHVDWRLSLLRTKTQDMHIPTVAYDKSSRRVRCGPFRLPRGGTLGQSLEAFYEATLASRNSVLELLQCFACLAALPPDPDDNDAEEEEEEEEPGRSSLELPEPTIADADTARGFLQRELQSALKTPAAAQSVQDALKSLAMLVKDSTPLSVRVRTASNYLDSSTCF